MAEHRLTSETAEPLLSRSMMPPARPSGRPRLGKRPPFAQRGRAFAHVGRTPADLEIGHERKPGEADKSGHEHQPDGPHDRHLPPLAGARFIPRRPAA